MFTEIGQLAKCQNGNDLCQEFLVAGNRFSGAVNCLEPVTLSAWSLELHVQNICKSFFSVGMFKLKTR